MGLAPSVKVLCLYQGLTLRLLAICSQPHIAYYISHLARQYDLLDPASQATTLITPCIVQYTCTVISYILLPVPQLPPGLVLLVTFYFKYPNYPLALYCHN